MLSAPISMRNIIVEVNRNAVVMARWGWNGSKQGHVVVVAGYDRSSSYVYYMDPGTSQQWSSMTYARFKGGAGSDRTWTHTRWEVATDA